MDYFTDIGPNLDRFANSISCTYVVFVFFIKAVVSAGILPSIL